MKYFLILPSLLLSSLFIISCQTSPTNATPLSLISNTTQPLHTPTLTLLQPDVASSSHSIAVSNVSQETSMSNSSLPQKVIIYTYPEPDYQLTPYIPHADNIYLRNDIPSSNSDTAPVVPKKILGEAVRIAGVLYALVAPWKNHKITENKALPEEDLVDVPLELTSQKPIKIHKDTNDCLLAMIENAAEHDIELHIGSGYRSVHYQEYLYKKKLKKGQTFAQIAQSVAPPYYSQHHLGTAVDFYPIDKSFSKNKAYKWLKANARDFGFSETYPKTGRIKGVIWEPWHWNFKKGTNCSP